MSGELRPERRLFDFAAGLAAPAPSERALFLRGAHAQAFAAEVAPSGFLDGRPLAGWCRERANGVAPDLRVGGVTYWVAVSDGKARAFSRCERVVTGAGGTRRSATFWRAVAAPNLRLLKMRLASQACVPVSAIQTFPTFEDGANNV